MSNSIPKSNTSIVEDESTITFERISFENFSSFFEDPSIDLNKLTNELKLIAVKPYDLEHNKCIHYSVAAWNLLHPIRRKI